MLGDRRAGVIGLLLSCLKSFLFGLAGRRAASRHRAKVAKAFMKTMIGSQFSNDMGPTTKRRGRALAASSQTCCWSDVVPSPRSPLNPKTGRQSLFENRIAGEAIAGGRQSNSS
jgi:hypothetical protein